MRCFERLAQEGHEALARGSARRAADRLREALDLWRGLPFAGLGDEGALRDEAARVVELRLLALEDRIEADLALGRDAELVDELERLLGDHPFRERFWRQLMLALYRAGRQADALAAYARAREALVAELGLEPGGGAEAAGAGDPPSRGAAGPTTPGAAQPAVPDHELRRP